MYVNVRALEDCLEEQLMMAIDNITNYKKCRLSCYHVDGILNNLVLSLTEHPFDNPLPGLFVLPYSAMYNQTANYPIPLGIRSFLDYRYDGNFIYPMAPNIKPITPTELKEHVKTMINIYTKYELYNLVQTQLSMWPDPQTNTLYDVLCISEREGFEDPKVGSVYRIDLPTAFYLDGDLYADFYTNEDDAISKSNAIRLNLNHFKLINEENEYTQLLVKDEEK